MATFPTAPEIQRPVPQAGASIPTARATPIGLEGARAMEVAGQQFQELAVLTDRYARRLDEADAQDALNKLAAKRAELTADPDKGFARLRGKAAMGEGPDGQPISKSFTSAFDLEREALGSKLSARARQAYEARASRESLAFKIDLVKHQTAQADKYETAVYADAQAMNVSRAAQSADDDNAIGILAGNAGNLARKRAEALGLPGDAAAMAAESDVLTAAVTMRISKGDPSAIGFFEKHKDRLDAKDRLALEPSIKTLRTNEEGKNLAAMAGGGGPSSETAKAGVKTSMDHWTAAGYSAPVAAGITAGFLRESQFSGKAVNPKDGRDGSDSINIGQWNSARATAFRNFAAQNGLDPDDVKTGLAYAKAEIDGVIPYSISGLSPDFKAKLQAAKSEKEAADIMTRGYFRPKHTEGESAIRQSSASTILAQYKPADPLATQVNAGTATVERDEKKDQGYDYDSVGKAEGPRGFLDTRKMKIDAEIWHRDATAEIAASPASPEAKKTAQHLIDVQFGQRKAAVQLAKDQLNDAVQDWVTKPDPKTGKT
jgi:hypothetical protein